MIVELKCVEKLANGHKKQLLTYLKLSGLKLGYLLNFSSVLMRDGVVRIVNCLGRSSGQITPRMYLADAQSTQRQEQIR